MSRKNSEDKGPIRPREYRDITSYDPMKCYYERHEELETGRRYFISECAMMVNEIPREAICPGCCRDIQVMPKEWRHGKLNPGLRDDINEYMDSAKTFSPMSEEEIFSRNTGKSKYKKPPLELMPRKENDRRRALEIIDAMRRFVEADKYIPEDWFDELEDLYVEN